MNFDVRQLHPKIILLTFKDAVYMCRTLVRFQEYAESPYFYKKIFTRASYRRWFRRYHNDPTARYEDTVAGFNIPSWSFNAFYADKFNPLHSSEKAILDALRKYEGRYYVIAVDGRDGNNNLRHELAHAVYYIDSDYRNQVNAILRELPKLKEARRHLILYENYHQLRTTDEVNSYLSADDFVHARHILGLKEFCNRMEYRAYKEIRLRLQKLLDRYLKIYNLSDHLG